MKFPKLILLSVHLYLFINIGVDVHAQNSRFFMETDRTEIAEGETFVLEIVLENMDGKNLQLPDLAPFKIVQGPSTSSSITIINGKRSGTQSYQYLLLATKKGKFTIGAASIQSGGKNIKSNTLSIEVTSAGKQITGLPENASSQTFVRLEVKDDQAYPGQQVILNLVLFMRTNIESFQLLNEPAFDGFYAQAINDIRDQPKTVNIKGKEYYTQVVRRWALFPQKTGTYNLGPVNCNLDIAVDNGQSSFFFRDTRQETVMSNTLKFKVENLPSPVPQSFTGAVGNFTMNAQIKKSNVSTGEGVTISMQIEGDGDSRIVQAPAFELPDGFEQYSPSLTKDETYQQGDKILMKKEFEYILVPSIDSTFTITPVFSYFDLGSSSYKTISSPPFTVNVIKDDDNRLPQNGNSQEVDLFTKPSSDDDLMSIDKGFFGSIWYFIILIGIVFSFFVVAYFKHYKKQDVFSKRESDLLTSDIVQKSISAASAYMDNNRPDLFYQEISSAIRHYIKKKFSDPKLSDDRNLVSEFLNDLGVPSKLVSDYKEIQNKCDLAKFAAVYGNMKEILQKTQGWISEMEEFNS
jgi:hypothetical protein